MYYSARLCPLYSPGKNSGVGCHALLQGIFLTQGSNPWPLHCKQIFYHWATREAPPPHPGEQGGCQILNPLQLPLSVFYSCKQMSFSPPWSGLSYVFYFAFWYDFKWDSLLYFPILLAWRNADDFYASVLYSATLLNLFTTASSWCVTSLGCSVNTVTSSAWHHNITSFLPIWTPFPSGFCFFFFWLLWLGFPISCWIEVVLGGILICSRFQWEGNQLVTSEHYVGYGLVLHCLFPSLLWEECLWWMVLNCMKCFSYVCGDDHVIFVFSFVDVLGHIDWCTLNHPSEPEVNPIWSWCMILFLWLKYL